MNTILTRKNEPKAFAIHYRRLEVRPISLPRNKLEYNSDGLFSDGDLPCKIVIAFVKTKVSKLLVQIKIIVVLSLIH